MMFCLAMPSAAYCSSSQQDTQQSTTPQNKDSEQRQNNTDTTRSDLVVKQYNAAGPGTPQTTAAGSPAVQPIPVQPIAVQPIPVASEIPSSIQDRKESYNFTIQGAD